MAFPVSIVPAGGFPVTQVSGLDGAAPFTPVDPPLYGYAITLVDSGGYPMVLVNLDGSVYSTGDSEMLLEGGDSVLLESGDILLLE